MRVTPRLFLLAGIAIVSAAVVADSIPTVLIPENYLLGHAPPGAPSPAKTATAKAASTVEKPAAVNGTLYAVIAPTYNGAGGTSSFIRLFNGGSSAATFSVTVVGSPSGTTYGTASIQIPVRASLQYPLNGSTASPGILQLANAAALNGGDTSYALYIQSVEATAGYQHVTFNSNNLFFENVSVCSTLLNQAIKAVVNSAALTNLHTSRLAAYPSQIEIHNYWNAPITYRVTVIDSATGAIKGQMNVPTAANASYAMPFSFFESGVGWTPAASEFHANIVVTDPSGGVPYVVLGQSIVNQSLSANISMTTACAVNAPATGSVGGGFGGGGISY